MENLKKNQFQKLQKFAISKIPNLKTSKND